MATGPHRRRRPRSVRAAGRPPLAGVVAAGVALGVSELVCGLAGPARRWSPPSARSSSTASRRRSRTSRSRCSARTTRSALVVGIVVVSLALGAVLGTASVRRPWVGVVGFVAFGARRPALLPRRPARRRRRPASSPPSLGRRRRHRHAVRAAAPRRALDGRRRPTRRSPRRGHAAGCSWSPPASLAAMRRRRRRARPAARTQRRRRRGPREHRTCRRPATSTPLPAPTASRRSPGLSPYITPNADFYRIDTALVVPQVDVAAGSSSIEGMVDRPVRAHLRRAASRWPTSRTS